MKFPPNFRVRYISFVAVVAVTILLSQVFISRYIDGFWLAVITIVPILFGFFFIIIPPINDLRRTNPIEILRQEIKTREDKLNINLNLVNALQNNLLANEKKYRKRVEDAADAIYETDFKGKYIYVSPSAEKLTGYSVEELLKLYFNELIDPDYRKDFEKFYQNQIANKIEKTYFEFPIRSKSGDKIWIGQTTRLIFDNDKLEKTHNVARDITEIHGAREMIRKSEKRFKLLAENSDVGIHEMNGDAKIIYTNRKWLEISGLEDSFTPEQSIAAIHPDDRSRITEAWGNGINNKIRVSLEFRFNHPQRGVVWVISTTSPLFDEQGELQGYIGSLTDITEIKNTYLKLEKSEETYRLISTNSQDLITLYKNDVNATRVFISPSAKNILGYEPDELIGKSPFDIILPEDAQRMRESIHTDTLKGVSANMEYRVRRKDGKIIWMETNSNPFFNDHGEMIGFQTSAREITQRKSYELALEQAKVKAEEANKAKSQFLSMMSHEIRTPMNAVIGLTSFMIEDNPPAHHLENLNLLKYSGENLLAIINDILDLSKIEADKIELNEVTFDLIELLENVIKIMQPRASAKSLDLLLSFNSDLPRNVKGDSVRINQVLVNLIGNAIKFTHAGSIELEVTINQ